PTGARGVFSNALHLPRRKTGLPAGIVEPLRELVAGLLIEEQRSDGRSPAQGVGAPLHHVEDVRRILGGGAEPGVLEAVDAGLQAAADLLDAMRVGDDR